MEMRISGVYKPLIFLRKESFFFRKVCFVIYVQTKEPHMGHLRQIEFFYAARVRSHSVSGEGSLKG